MGNASLGFSRDRPEVDAEDVSIETHSLMIAHSATAAPLYSRSDTRLTLRVCDGIPSAEQSHTRISSRNTTTVSGNCIPALHAVAARHVML